MKQYPFLFFSIRPKGRWISIQLLQVLLITNGVRCDDLNVWSGLQRTLPHMSSSLNLWCALAESRRGWGADILLQTRTSLLRSPLLPTTIRAESCHAQQPGGPHHRAQFMCTQHPYSSWSTEVSKGREFSWALRAILYPNGPSTFIFRESSLYQT